MAHNEYITCPNCGTEANGNFCHQCGQQNHLHNDTFLGLIAHFASHYIHYDSKFWQTLRTLWFKPGALTIAYSKKQYMRYIPPISLYIFISFLYFFAGSITQPYKEAYNIKNERQTDARIAQSLKSINKSKSEKDSIKLDGDFIKINLNNTGNKNAEKIKEQFLHNRSKIFFFMIPVLALILKLLFIRRKNIFYVHHAIFSLHYHSFWFSLWMIDNLLPFSNIIISGILSIFSTIYMISSLRKVYHIGLGRAISYTIIIGAVYLITLLIVSILIALALIYMAQ